MSYRHTLEAALESLQDIEELIKGFPDNGDVPSIELDLSLQKLRNIYELLLVLKKSADPSAVQSPASASPTASASPSATATSESTSASEPVSAPASAPVSAPVSTQASAPAPEPPSTPVSAPPSATPAATPPPVLEKETIITIQVEKETTETVRTSEPAATARQQATGHRDDREAQILSDRYRGRTTLHETLHQSLGRDTQLHAQGKPVDNLMSAIGINDRFTFIRELFNGDSPAFENAIRVLNDAANFNDAYNFMIQNYDWDMDSDAVQLLLDIIRRKYIISRHE